MEKYRLLFESVTARKSERESDLTFLEKIAAEHPYFSPVQFYLLQLLPQDTDFYRTQAKKTSALFNNNYWLNFQLQESAAELTGMLTPQAGTTFPGNDDRVAPPAGMEESFPAHPASNDMDAATTSVEQTGGATNDEGAGTFDVVEAAMLPSEELPATTDTKSAMHEADLAPAETVDEAPATGEPAAPVFEPGAEIPVTEAETTAGLAAATSDEHTEAEAPEMGSGNLAAMPAAPGEATISAMDAPAEEPVAATAEPAAGTGIDHIETTTSAPTDEDTSSSIAAAEKLHPETADLQEVKEAEEAATPTGEPNPDEPGLPGMSFPLPAVSAATNGTEMLFEPLHTSDYFASVGIRLSEEEKSGDRLGKQLKSFTDWLKTMKKVHASQLVQVTQTAEVEAAGAESKIQKLAERSNQDNEVLTEAMADVLLQQGRQEKATEILQKLSLLNPTKSAYFAAKINQIKEK